MGRRYPALAGMLALAACAALAGCGGATSFGMVSGMSCVSDTSCTVSVTSPAGNSDTAQWALTSSDSRVVIAPAYGTIAPGQMVTAAVMLPAGVCPITLTLNYSGGGIWLFTTWGGGAQWAAVSRDASGACQHPGPPPTS